MRLTLCACVCVCAQGPPAISPTDVVTLLAACKQTNTNVVELTMFVEDLDFTPKQTIAEYIALQRELLGDPAREVYFAVFVL